MDIKEEILTLIRARYPVIYIVSHEEDRVVQSLTNIPSYSTYVWSLAYGIRESIIPIPKEGDPLDNINEETRDPLMALEHIKNKVGNCIFILCDFYKFLGGPMADAQVIRYLRDLIRELKGAHKNIIILSPILELPTELEKDVAIIDYPLPDKDKVKSIIVDIKKHVEKKGLPISISNGGMEALVRSLQGLTENEITNVIYKSIVHKRTIDLDLIINEKEKIIRKSGVLEYYHQTEDLRNVGGLDELKRWIKVRKNAFSEKARDYGLPYPKGVLLLGVQGCGKSLCAKVIPSLWKFPLLKMDVGQLFGSLVGESEKNIRLALKTAEAIAPCILWIDEIEKGFSGLGSSNTSDSGTTARVFATFLTWMQENQKPVFIVATANSIDTLPPEFLRKGRFDEIFFVDLPNAEERREIVKIHLQKRGRNPKKFDIERIVSETEGYSGAEIESAIIDGLFDAFDEGVELTTEHIISNIKKIIPISKMRKEEIERLRNWASRRARFATSHKVKSKPKRREVDIEI